MIKSILNLLTGKRRYIPDNIKVRCYCRHDCDSIRDCKAIELTKNGSPKRPVSSMHSLPINGKHPVLMSNQTETKQMITLQSAIRKQKNLLGQFKHKLSEECYEAIYSHCMYYQDKAEHYNHLVSESDMLQFILNYNPLVIDAEYRFTGGESIVYKGRYNGWYQFYRNGELYAELTGADLELIERV